MPFDLDAERSVLGSCLISPDASDEVAIVLTADDFHDPNHAELWRTMLELRERSSAIDPVLLAEALQSRGSYEQVGGAVYLAQLFQSVPNAAHATYYARIVRDKSLLRGLLLASADIASDVYDETRATTEVISAAEQRIFDVAERGVAATAGTVDVRVIVESALERMRTRREGELTGATTGLVDLDSMTGGIRASEFWVVGGRPSMGKTSLGLGIVHAAAAANKRTLLVSLEMSGAELGERMLSMRSRINLHRMRAGTITTEDRQRLVEAAANIAALPIVVDDGADRTITQIAAVARRERRRRGLDLIVVDYLQICAPDSPRDPRQEQVAKMARRLKLIARELSVGVLALAQVNRTSDRAGECPRLSDLRESGAIEQDADVVVFVHRPAYYQRHDESTFIADAEEAELHVAKQRNGPCGVSKVLWQRRYASFESLAPARLQGGDWTETSGGYDFGIPPADAATLDPQAMPATPQTPAVNPQNRRDLF